MISLVRGRLALALAFLVPAFATAAAQAPTAQEATKPSAERRLLGGMSRLPEDEIMRLPGMTGESVAKVMKFRQGGGTFTSIAQFRTVSGLTDEQYSLLVTNFNRKFWLEQEDPPVSAKAPLSKAPPKGLAAERGKPAAPGDAAPPSGDGPPTGATGGGLGIEVKGNYYSILPGYDLSVLSDDERAAFLETINTEVCPCGCTGETLGFCLVNDPGCMVVKAKVKKIYKDLTGKEPTPKAASAEE